MKDLLPCAIDETVWRNGGPIITDGPFAETKELIGGCHPIEGKDTGGAIAIAPRIPALRAGGSVEVRSVEPDSGGRAGVLS